MSLQFLEIKVVGILFVVMGVKSSCDLQPWISHSRFHVNKKMGIPKDLVLFVFGITSYT